MVDLFILGEPQQKKLFTVQLVNIAIHSHPTLNISHPFGRTAEEDEAFAMFIRICSRKGLTDES